MRAGRLSLPLSAALPGRRWAAASAFLYARCGPTAGCEPPMLCICCARKTRPDISACQSGFPLGSLRSTFSNLTPRLKTLVTRWKRGVHRAAQRPEPAPMEDSRAPVVRRIEHLQTLLTASEADRLVDDYLDGAAVNELADGAGGTGCLRLHRPAIVAKWSQRSAAEEHEQHDREPGAPVA